MPHRRAVQRFVEHVRAECRKHGVRFLLQDTKKVDQSGSGGCSGYFCDHRMVLAVARRSRYWIEVLVHEYCHMRQWLEGSRAWRRSGERAGWYWDWVDGRIRKPKHMTATACRRQLEVELDCERRAVRMARKWRLGIDLRKYVREANAYILFYTFIRLNGVWYNKSPTRVPQIVETMPERFMRREWYERLPRDYAYLVFSQCLTPAKQRRAWAWLLAA